MKLSEDTLARRRRSGANAKKLILRTSVHLLTSDVEKSKIEKPSTPIYNEVKELPNIYYKPVSFGRSLAEHKSWGAVIDPQTKEASFKIFTYLLIVLSL